MQIICQQLGPAQPYFAVRALGIAEMILQSDDALTIQLLLPGANANHLPAISSCSLHPC
jgi:hypothetical protein